MNHNFINLASSLAVSVLGVLVGFYWTSVVSAPIAGKIVMGLGVAKTLYNAFVPSAPTK